MRYAPKLLGIHEARERRAHPDRPYIDTPYARGEFLGRDADRLCATKHALQRPLPPPVLNP